jgi:Trypsin
VQLAFAKVSQQLCCQQTAFDSPPFLGIRECPRIRNTLVQQKSDDAYIEYVKQSNAACNYVRPFVCCEPTSAPSKKSTCGASPKTQNRVVGGDAASLGSWPWVALLGYKDSLGGIIFKCGGSLISPRHVLTAAQCNRKNM